MRFSISAFLLAMFLVPTVQAFPSNLLNTWVKVKELCGKEGEKARPHQTFPNFKSAPKWYLWQETSGIVRGRYTWPHENLQDCRYQLEGEVETINDKMEFKSLKVSADGNSCFAAPQDRPSLQFSFKFARNGNLVISEERNQGKDKRYSLDCELGESFEAVFMPASAVPSDVTNESHSARTEEATH